MQKFTLTLVFGIIAIAVASFFFTRDAGAPGVLNDVGPVAVTSFEECVRAGNPIMESYPQQCRSADGTLFVEEITVKEDLPTREISGSGEYMGRIEVESPKAGGVIRSPLGIRGQARGNWYFEASFPVTLVDWDGRIIAESYAQAKGEWMTEDFVPFTSIVVFKKPYAEGEDVPEFMKWGTLILKKDNPSGLPEHDAAIEIPVRFE